MKSFSGSEPLVDVAPSLAIDPLARSGTFPRWGNTLADLVAVFGELDVWRGVLALNTFEGRIVFRGAPPFEAALGQPLADLDFDRMRLWLETQLGVRASRANLTDAARIVAAEHAFHPVSDYLSGLAWDGTPRVDRWLETYAAVVPTSDAHAAMVRAVARKWLVSCVARAKDPGCKVDTMLILEGRQGIGKSSALRALAGDRFFCDSLIDIGSKEACQTIQGVWIYELPELDALLRRETSVGKSFLSRGSDRFRKPYGRAPETVPRSVVFSGTVNHGEYLKDRSGNRRFWVIRCGGSLDVSGLAEARDLLWAEARHLYEAGEPWHLEPAEEAQMREEQAARLEGDPLEDAVADWVARREGQPFTMVELLQTGLALSPSARTPTVMSRVSRILGGLGFERRRLSTRGLGAEGSAGGKRPYFYAQVRCPDVRPGARPGVAVSLCPIEPEIARSEPKNPGDVS
jgi:putative DNA primase/helicase